MQASVTSGGPLRAVYALMQAESPCPLAHLKGIQG